jgi:hypothetical protein
MANKAITPNYGVVTLIVITCALGLYFHLSHLYLGFKSRSWPQATATVIDAEELMEFTAKSTGTRKSVGETIYSIQYTYSYAVNGAEYKNTAICKGDCLGNYYQDDKQDEVFRALSKIKNSKITIFYNPHKPTESVSESERGSPVWFPLEISVFSISAGILFWRKRRKARSGKIV